MSHCISRPCVQTERCKQASESRVTACIADIVFVIDNSGVFVHFQVPGLSILCIDTSKIGEQP